MSNQNNDHQGQSVVEEEDVSAVQEEIWEEMDVVDGCSSTSRMELHEIWINKSYKDDEDNNDGDDEDIQKRQNSIPFRYKSISTNQLTPVDMNYSSEDSEYYDGTGTIVWMAALIFVPVVVNYIPTRRRYDMNLVVEYDDVSSTRKHFVCELGCGAGVAGMAIAKFTTHSTKVVFTDNDPKALELCRENCILNGLSSENCQFELLEWTTHNDIDGVDGNNDLRRNTSLPSNEFFDTVIATDVLYEIIMIPPLLQTASRLLKSKGYFWLSHVPRFYLPKVIETDNNDVVENVKNDNDNNDTIASLNLENYIIEEATKVGLELIETIRPQQLYDLASKTLVCRSKNQNQSQFFTFEKLCEIHAVVFVFQKTIAK